MEFVGVFEFADVEFGLEGADVGLGAAGGAVGVVVVEEAEDGSEFVLREAWEQRHFACSVVFGLLVGLNWEVLSELAKWLCVFGLDVLEAWCFAFKVFVVVDEQKK